MRFSESATEHAVRSLSLAFPGRAPPVVCDELRAAIAASVGPPEEVRAYRKEAVELLQELQRNHFPEQKLPDGRLVPNVELFRYLLTVTEYDDLEAADILAGEAFLLGKMGGPEEWPEAEPPSVPPLSRSEIFSAHLADREALLLSIRPSKHDQDLLDASEADVKLGRMEGPFGTLPEVGKALGTDHFIVSRRFGVEQTDKVRPCDDLTRAYVNAGIEVQRKLKLSTLDSFFALAYAIRAALAAPSRPETETPRAGPSPPVRAGVVVDGMSRESPPVSAAPSGSAECAPRVRTNETEARCPAPSRVNPRSRDVRAPVVASFPATEPEMTPTDTGAPPCAPFAPRPASSNAPQSPSDSNALPQGRIADAALLELLRESDACGLGLLGELLELLPEPALPLSSDRADSGLRWWKQDHDGAYRQIPLPRGDRPLTVVAFCHPETGKLVYYFHRALPFGAVASVYKYNRVSRAAVFLARRILGVPVDSYFDDFWGVDSAAVVESGFDAFVALHDCLGLFLKKKKEMRPDGSGILLGVHADIGRLPFRASLCPSRRLKLRCTLVKTLQADSLRHGAAATLAGQLGFAGTAIFGSIGRAQLRCIYHQSYLRPGTRGGGRSAAAPISPLSPGLKAALEFFLALLSRPPSRVIADPCVFSRHVSLYTDGAGDGCIGAVLLIPQWPALALASHVSRRVLSMLQGRKNQIALIELLAVLAAVDTFAEFLRGHDVLLWIDNVVAEAAVRNGYLRQDCWDGCAIASALWLAIWRLSSNVWTMRVPSLLNISDGPSRPKDPSKLSPLLQYPLGVRWMQSKGISAWALRALDEAVRVR